MKIKRTGNAWLSLYNYDGHLLIRTRDWKAVQQICTEYLERTGKDDNGVLNMLNKKVATLNAAAPSKSDNKTKTRVKPPPEPEPEPAPKPKRKKKEKTAAQKLWD